MNRHSNCAAEKLVTSYVTKKKKLIEEIKDFCGPFSAPDCTISWFCGQLTFFFFPVVVFCRGIFLQYEAEWGIWFCSLVLLYGGPNLLCPPCIKQMYFQIHF